MQRDSLILAMVVVLLVLLVGKTVAPKIVDTTSRAAESIKSAKVSNGTPRRGRG